MGRLDVVLDRGAVHDAAGRRRAHLRRRAARVPEGVRRRSRGDDAGAAARAAADAAAALAAYLRGSRRCSPTVGASCSAAPRRIADFSAAQSIWFMRRAAADRGAARRLSGTCRLVRARGGVRPWRIDADGERRRDRAGRRGAEPRADMRSRAGAGFAPATRSPSPPPTTPTTRSPARSSASTPTRSSSQRDDARAGRVHVHFPRIGFHIKAARKERRMKTFKGGTAVITGAGSGFGLEASRIAAQRGMNVVMADVQQDALDRAAAEFARSAPQVLPFRLDVAHAGRGRGARRGDEAALRRAAHRLQQRRRRRRRPDLGEHAPPTGSGCSAST